MALFNCSMSSVQFRDCNTMKSLALLSSRPPSPVGDWLTHHCTFRKGVQASALISKYPSPSTSGTAREAGEEEEKDMA